MDFVGETLTIVNADVNGHTYSNIWAAHWLKIMSRKYMGVCMVEFRHCFSE